MIRDRWKSELGRDEPDDPQQSGSGVGGGPWLAAADRSFWSGVLLKRWPWIAVTAAVVVAAAAGGAQLQTPIYTAQATVAVYPASGTTSGLQPFVMGTEKGIASSGAVLSLASQSLLIPESKLQHGLSVTVPADADLLVISYSDPNPQVAQSAAEGIAQAYVGYRSSINGPTPARNTSAPPATAGAVQAIVITDAALPASPVSPNRLLIIGVAVIVGLALGLGAALLRDWMDDGLRGSADLETQANVPVLGQIPALRRMKAGIPEGLVVVSSPNSPIAGAYLDLRTRVLHAAAPRGSNTLLVTSARDEDKTTIAANLSAALAQSGRKVVLVCADPRWGKAAQLFGLDGELGLSNVVRGDAKLGDVLLTTEVRGLRLLPTGPSAMDPSSVTQSTGYQRLLKRLRTENDFVVLDAPPVLASADTGTLAELGAMVLLVADARSSTRACVRAAAAELGHVGDDVIGSVLDGVGRGRRLPEPSKRFEVRRRSTAAISPRRAARDASNQDVDDEPAASDRTLATVTAGDAVPMPAGHPETSSNGSFES